MFSTARATATKRSVPRPAKKSQLTVSSSIFFELPVFAGGSASCLIVMFDGRHLFSACCRRSCPGMPWVDPCDQCGVRYTAATTVASVAVLH